MTDLERLVELLEAVESAVYWNSGDKSFVEKIADYLITNGVTVQEWIPVEERLPCDDCDWVLAIGKFVPENTYGKPIISELRKAGKWWKDTNDEFPLEDMGIRITHWMPLPEPPKEDNHETD